MSTRKERQQQLFIVSVIIAAFLSCVVYLGIAIWGFEQSKEPPAPPPPVRQSFGPDISKCPGNVDLWVCIRHAMYRRDI